MSIRLNLLEVSDWPPPLVEQPMHDQDWQLGLRFELISINSRRGLTKGHVEPYDGKVNIWNAVDRSNLRDFSSSFATSDSTDAIEPVIQRIYLTMAPIGTQLYFLAGYRLPGELFRFMSAVHTFNTSAGDAWRSFEPKEEERDKELCGHCCVVQVS
ncbi:F-box/kelch-repeat-like protein [Cinnamomum micranthum f. kanehirae]|uniref:F-box/kelch-repeat-like protein n=1 Tax=Cinnamomum micranthum f. kanehirae TaxID=337451 RepID=A0A443PIY0_9MAGN|nr:F-box/kelch-repeat-like protein [Cinnamomum micranthum f. kanehirae]